MEVVWLVHEGQRDKSILLTWKNEVFIACASGIGEHLVWCVFAELNAVDFGDYLRKDTTF